MSDDEYLDSFQRRERSLGARDDAQRARIEAMGHVALLMMLILSDRLRGRDGFNHRMSQDTALLTGCARYFRSILPTAPLPTETQRKVEAAVRAILEEIDEVLGPNQR
jgi:hypothetical protein